MATIATGVISGYGNEIDKDNVALMRDFILGYDYGIFVKNKQDFDARIILGTQGENAIEISTGQLYAYGYVGRLPEPVVFDLLLPATEQYWFIYGEIDLSRVPNTFTIKAKNNGRSPNTTWRQDVLSAVKTGIFQMPLWRFRITSNGIDASSRTSLRALENETRKITADDEHKIKQVERVDSSIAGVGKCFIMAYEETKESIEGGTQVGGGDLVYLKHSLNKNTGEFSLSQQTEIGTLTVGAEFYRYGKNKKNIEYGIIERISADGDVSYAYGQIKSLEKTISAATATTQDRSDNSDKVATNEFVHNVLDRKNNSRFTNISFSNITTNISAAQQIGWVGRRYNHVVGRIFLLGYRLTQNGVKIATIPEEYRPLNNITFVAGYSEAGTALNYITVTIQQNGDVYTSGTTQGFYISLNFGYEK